MYDSVGKILLTYTAVCMPSSRRLLMLSPWSFPKNSPPRRFKEWTMLATARVARASSDEVAARCKAMRWLMSMPGLFVISDIGGACLGSETTAILCLFGGGEGSFKTPFSLSFVRARLISTWGITSLKTTHFSFARMVFFGCLGFLGASGSKGRISSSWSKASSTGEGTSGSTMGVLFFLSARATYLVQEVLARLRRISLIIISTAWRENTLLKYKEKWLMIKTNEYAKE